MCLKTEQADTWNIERHATNVYICETTINHETFIN